MFPTAKGERKRNVILLSTEIYGNNTGEVALH